MANSFDLAKLSDKDIEKLQLELYSESDRRARIASGPSDVDSAISRYQRAVGRSDGDKWVEPTAAADAYVEGSVVAHGGADWVSAVPGNLDEPGIGEGWKKAKADPGEDDKDSNEDSNKDGDSDDGKDSGGKKDDESSSK